MRAIAIDLRRALPRGLSTALLLPWVVAGGCGGEPETPDTTRDASVQAVAGGDAAAAALFEAIDRSEEVLLELSAYGLPPLSEAVRNLSLKGSDLSAVLAPTVHANDLAAPADPLKPAATLEHIGLETHLWPVTHDDLEIAGSELDLWRPFLDQVDWFEHAKFYNIDGHFLDDAETQYESKTGFKALARLTNGKRAYATAKLSIHWHKHVDGDETSWLATDIHTKVLETQEAVGALFRDVLDDVVHGPDARSRARASIHEELVLEQFLNEEFQPPHEYFSLPAFDRHPGIAVVDLDRDGFDDFYLMQRWGRNLFFRNRGDGTFEEIASDIGLDVEGHTSSAIFADFDNDGDADAFLGRTLERSAFYENRDGRFVDRTAELVEGLPPYLVSSVSAVDYDQDGLLDLYFSTYAAQMVLVHGVEELAKFIDKKAVREIYTRYGKDKSHKIRNRPGPPNVLIRNVGGGFEVVEDPGPLAGWHNTYQSTWADFDRDGDMDVYLANDFAMNNLVRNEGDGRFTDVTAETATADIGFGMGATWGDYDNDGRQDLYVTNMFSKAGRRITTKAGDLGKDFEAMAQGNSLLRNGPAGFETVSTVDGDDFRVSAAGWGWGSQFFDVDNDGYLDIYALSGFYTTPKQVAIAEDT